MNTPHNANSSDLELGARLSRKLTGAATSNVSTPPTAAATTVPPFRWQRPSPVGTVGSVAAAMPSAPADEPDAPLGAPGPGLYGDWQGLATWAMTQADATSAFIMDSQGLLVASAGAAAPSEIEGTGARLLFALHQGEGLAEQAPEAIELGVGDQCFTGLRLESGDGLTMMLGCITGKPLRPEVRGHLRSALRPFLDAR